MTGLVLLLAVSVSTIFAGFRLRRRTPSSPRKVLAVAVTAGAMAMAAALVMTLLETPALAATGATSAASGMAYIGASLATGMACLGAGIAVAMVGAAALGTVAEKPELLGTTLIYMGLAEGIAIYGVIVSLLILGKV